MSLAHSELPRSPAPAADEPGPATPPEAPGETRPRRPAAAPRRVARKPPPRPAPTARRRAPRSPYRGGDGGGSAVGTLLGWNDAGEPVVRDPRDPSGRPVLARTTVYLDATHLGREVLLAYDRTGGGPPVVTGVLLKPGERPAVGPPGPDPVVERRLVEATLDGDRLVLSAGREIELRCGEASLTLTRAGKVLIRGTYLLSRSSGVNRIKGGSVQIN